MDLDFDQSIKVRCVECANVFSLEEAEAINEATSSAKCPYCGRFNFIDVPSLFECYIEQMNEEDDGGKLYDFRTGKLEYDFPTSYKRVSKKEKKEKQKQKNEMIEQLKEELRKQVK